MFNIDIPLGERITAIAGKNGTMKTTLLGIIGQPFSMNEKSNPMCAATTVDGNPFTTELIDKFKFSPTKDIPGHHRWDVLFENDKICAEKIYPVNSIVRSKEDGNLRFWHATSKKRGSGFKTLPVIYLSLQRLSPLGESKIGKLDLTSLTPEEKEFYQNYHNIILCCQTKFVDSGVTLGSQKKATISGETLDYDYSGISAGQDNIGKILMAIISFRRLKDNYSENYNGGILLIDELDATLHPAAQEKMVEVLFRFASDLNLQVVFTTHSINILCKLKESQYNYDSSIIYLYERGGKVLCHHNPSIGDMQNDLNVVARNPKDVAKINVFCEDDIGRSFAKTILGKKINDKVNYHKKYGSISAEHYHVFVDDNIEIFLNSVIILDGDKKAKHGKTPVKKNIVILPPNCNPYPTCPEKMFYKFLNSLSDTDVFWDNSLGGYTKETCFRNYPNDPENTKKYKEWFQEQKEYWGRGCTKLYKRWINDNPIEVERFKKDFVAAHNFVAQKLELPQISL